MAEIDGSTKTVSDAVSELDNALNEMSIVFSSIKSAGVAIVDSPEEIWIGEAIKMMAERGEQIAEHLLETSMQLLKGGANDARIHGN